MDRFEEEYRTIVDDIQDGYFEVDLAGTFTYANPAASEIYGYPGGEIIGVNYRQYTDELNSRKALAAFSEIHRTGVPGKLFDYEITRRDGTKRQVELSASLIVDRSGQPLGFRGITRDISERKQMEEKLRRSEERFRNFIEDTEDAYFEVDLKGRFTFTNDALCKNLGYCRDELIGMDQRHYAGKKTIRELYTLFNRVYRTGVPVRAYTFELYRKNGSRGYSEISVTPLKDEEGRIVGFRGIARDITGRKKREKQIRHLATHDILTGLPNRILFQEMLEQNIKHAHRYRQQLALLFMDLDGFKMINDTFGHETGDQVLIVSAMRLKQALRSTDFIARLGGDEFVVLVKDVTGKKGLITLVNTIFSIVGEPILIRGREHRLTASIGISIYPQDGRDERSLMKTADLAMYSAKEKGSNNYQFYSTGVKPPFQGRDILEKQLPRALEREEMFLEYQPIFELQSGAVSGVEALLRWRNPDRGMVDPRELIPAAERTGEIIPIGRWMLRTACLQGVAWQRRGLPEIRIAVNLSQRQLLDEQLIDDLKAALAEAGLKPELLELEITENLLLVHFPHVVKVLNGLKSVGVRLALDNYGAGYSSLAQIRQLPVDTLKIDRSIVGKTPGSKIDRAMVEVITGMGRALDLTVVAGGVERAEQLEFLRESSCDLLQGIYLSRPLLPGEAAAFIGKNRAPR